MTRDLNADIEDVFMPALLLELNLDSDDENIWTGSGDLDWNGKTWLGGGEFISFSAVKEGTQLQDDRITLSLSGISDLSDFITEFNEVSPVGRSWTLYLAVFSELGKIQSVDTMSAGFVDSVGYVDGNTKAVSIILATEAVFFNRSRFYRMDDAMQQNLFAGDKFFEFVTGLPDDLQGGSAPPFSFGGVGSIGSAEIGTFGDLR